MRRNNRNQYNRNQQNNIQNQYEQSFISENNMKQDEPKPIPLVNMQQQSNTPLFSSDNNGSQMNVDGENGDRKKIWRSFGPKKNLTAAQRKEKKRIQNKRLRKLLAPKNAIVALNELRGPDMGEFTINPDGINSFTAEIVVNNVKYTGQANTKQMAKMKASEKALRDLVITKMNKNDKGGETDGSDDVEMKNVTEGEDFPMIHLASFALHKLFSEWQNEGFEIPELNISVKKMAAAAAVASTNAATPTMPKPKVLKTISDLPADASSRHPASLLAFMRPQSAYVDLGQSGAPPNAEFTIGVSVDEKQFIGKGRSKKTARRNAAAEACKQIWGVEFNEAAMNS